jgi:uncharacterized PurR-regulated membrane protein YhhQ (DUF165 family)
VHRLAILTAYVATVWAANLLTDAFHLHPLVLGLLVPAGTWAAGAALIARDLLHETAGRAWVAAGIALGVAVSALTTSPALALASGVAFAVSELADWGVYSKLRKRSPGRAVLLSSLIGAPVDTALFLWLSGIGLTWQALAGQVLVKVGLALAIVGGREVIRRAVPRQRQLSAGA